MAYPYVANIAIACIVLNVVFFCLRVWARLVHTQRLIWADLLVTLSLVFNLGVAALQLGMHVLPLCIHSFLITNQYNSLDFLKNPALPASHPSSSPHSGPPWFTASLLRSPNSRFWTFTSVYSPKDGRDTRCSLPVSSLLATRSYMFQPQSRNAHLWRFFGTIRSQVENATT